MQGEDLHEWGTIHTEKSSDFSARLLEMGQDIETLMLSHRPQRIIIESLSYIRHAPAALQVAQARGIVCFLAAKNDIPITEMAPSELKKRFTGKGNATKAAMKKMAVLVFGVEEKNLCDDAVDALALAWCGR